jgi:hypothetical protein
MRISPVYASAESKTGTGLTISKARERGLSLQPAMSQEAVQNLLGVPDETAVTTYDSSTLHPWRRLE